MSSIVPAYPPTVNERLLKHLRRCRDAKLHRRYLIIINLLNHRGAYQTAEVVGVANSTVYRVAQRFMQRGEVGLLESREDNGDAKLDERYLKILEETVCSSPPRNHCCKNMNALLDDVRDYLRDYTYVMAIIHCASHTTTLQHRAR